MLIFVIAILSVLGVGLLFCFFMLARNQWVFNTKEWWREHPCNAYLDYLMEKGKYSPRLQTEMYDAIWDHNKMMRRFWVWKLDKMVENGSLYTAVSMHYRAGGN